MFGLWQTFIQRKSEYKFTSSNTKAAVLTWQLRPKIRDAQCNSVKSLGQPGPPARFLEVIQTLLAWEDSKVPRKSLLVFDIVSRSPGARYPRI